MKIKHYSYLLIVVLVSFFSSCLERPEYPLEPKIEFISINKTTIAAGPQGVSLEDNNTDTLVITIGFTDGDGDIDGIQGKDTLNGLKIIDLRDNSPIFIEGIRLPEIEYAGISNGISGEIEFIISNADFCCKNLALPNLQPCQKTSNGVTEEVIFSISLSDHSGNESNFVETPAISINCWE